MVEDLTKKLIKARKKAIEFESAMNQAYSELLRLVPNAEYIKTNAENAENLFDAVGCFAQYGEYSVDGIISEVNDAVKGGTPHGIH